MKNINKITAIGLIAGAILQIIRMMPIAMSDGIKMLENFPPHNLEDTVFAAQLYGWHISHIMVFVATPLLMAGFYGLYRLVTENGKLGIAVYALIGLGIGLLLYTIGAVIDGLLLPELAEQITQSSGNEKEQLGVIITYSHEFAVSFGGLSFAFLLLSTGIMGLGLNHVEGLKIFGIIGIVIGVLATIGYITGILDLLVTGSFLLTGGLTMLMFIYYLVLGIKVFRIKT